MSENPYPDTSIHLSNTAAIANLSEGINDLLIDGWLTKSTVTESAAYLLAGLESASSIAEANEAPAESVVENTKPTAPSAEESVRNVGLLADIWEARGESDLVFSKSVPADIAEQMCEEAAEMVNRARMVRMAVAGELQL